MQWNLKQNYKKRFAIKVNPETVRRIIRSYGYNNRITRRKVFVNKRVKKLCLDIEKSMVDKDISFWETVIFVDESKFTIFGSDGRITVWKKPNEEVNLKNKLLTVKNRGRRPNGIGTFCCFWYGKFSFHWK